MSELKNYALELEKYDVWLKKLRPLADDVLALIAWGRAAANRPNGLDAPILSAAKIRMALPAEVFKEHDDRWIQAHRIGDLMKRLDAQRREFWAPMFPIARIVLAAERGKAPNESALNESIRDYEKLLNKENTADKITTPRRPSDNLLKIMSAMLAMKKSNGGFSKASEARTHRGISEASGVAFRTAQGILQKMNKDGYMVECNDGWKLSENGVIYAKDMGNKYPLA